jgi:hypothetical protein
VSFGVFPLTPAYGRDYSSLAELKKDFLAGKDFVCADGRGCSVCDFKKGAMISVRYAAQRKAASFKL